MFFMSDEYQGRPLEELAKRAIPVIHEIFKDREIVSRREILGSFCDYKELGDLTVQETVSLVNYLIKEKTITFSSYHHNASWFRLNP